MIEIQPYEHKVQYYETDQMGIVHHSNYIRWFEEGRTYVLDQAGFGYKKMEECGILSPVLGVNAQYKSMTYYEDVVLIDTSVVFYNGIKMMLAYTIRDKKTNDVRCTGESSHCFLNREGKPISLKKYFPQVHELMEGLLLQHGE